MDLEKMAVFFRPSSALRNISVSVGDSGSEGNHPLLLIQEPH